MSMAGSASPGLQLAAGSPASMLHAAFSPRASSPLVDPQGGAHTLTPTHKPSISSHPVQRIETQEGGPAEAQGLPGVPHRGPSPFSSGPQVWAENGGMEALVGGTYPGGRGGSVEERGALPGGGVPGVRSLPLAPSDTLVCLPPQRRAQLVLREMAGMARRLLDLAQGQSGSGPASKPVAVPQLLASACLPPEASSAQTLQDALGMLEVQQHLLSECANELQEIQALSEKTLEVRAQTEATNAALKAFALNLYEAESRLGGLLEEYHDYRALKRLKPSPAGQTGGQASGQTAGETGAAQGSGGDTGTKDREPGGTEAGEGEKDGEAGQEGGGVRQVGEEAAEGEAEGDGERRRKKAKTGHGKGEVKREQEEEEEGPWAVDVKDLVAYADHISLTTFAAPEMAQGRPPVGRVLPPCPQDDQLRASLWDATSQSDPAAFGVIKVQPPSKAPPTVTQPPLHDTVHGPPGSAPSAPSAAAAAAAGAAGVPGAPGKTREILGAPADGVPAPHGPGAGAGAGAGAVAPNTVPTAVLSPPSMPPLPPGWKPGDPLPDLPGYAKGMPLPGMPPPGWKPGDPVAGLVPLPPMPPGWKPGDPVGGMPLPPMPPGWKPGDPLPLPALAGAGAAKGVGVPAAGLGAGLRAPAGDGVGAGNQPASAAASAAAATARAATAAGGAAGAAAAVAAAAGGGGAGGAGVPAAAGGQAGPPASVRHSAQAPVLQVAHVELDFEDDDDLDEDSDELSSDED